jgi:hypothetical protein
MYILVIGTPVLGILIKKILSIDTIKSEVSNVDMSLKLNRVPQKREKNTLLSRS